MIVDQQDMKEEGGAGWCRGDISIHISTFFFFEYVQIISCSNSKSNIAAAVRARAVKAFEI